MKGSMTIVITCLLCSGCATTPYSVPVSKEAKESTPGEGIPYYLPHPFLVISKNMDGKSVVESQTKKPDGTSITTTTTSPVGIQTNQDVFAMQIVYLPDSSQKYALRFRRGWGSYKTTVNLIDGWKLAGLNMEGDAKTAETIAAVGTVAKDIAAVGTAVAGRAADGTVAKNIEAEAQRSGISLSAEIKDLLVKQLEAQVPERRCGIWVFDLMGEKAFQEVFHWSE